MSGKGSESAVGIVSDGAGSAVVSTGSLRPAIAAHVLFNVGGVVAGVIYAVMHLIATGRPPSPPG